MSDKYHGNLTFYTGTPAEKKKKIHRYGAQGKKLIMLLREFCDIFNEVIV